MKVLVLVLFIITGVLANYKVKSFQHKPCIIYWLRTSHSAKEKKQIKILSINQDSLVVGLSGSSIILSNNIIDFFSENGYTKVVGGINKKGNSFYLKHSTVSRTINILGENLPNNSIITPVKFIGSKKLLIEKSAFIKIDSTRLSFALRKILYPKQ